MELTVTLDSRYQVAPDGSVWSQAGMARSFWERYLEVFSKVRVVARATPVERPPEGWLPVTGKGIEFVPLPDFLGPAGYLKNYNELQAAIRTSIPASGAVIMRVGSQIANDFQRYLEFRNRPFALEVIGDPYDVFAPGVIEHPLRAFFRWHFSRNLRKQCEKAIAVAYVTRKALQMRYPTRALSTSVSDVDLNEDALLENSQSTHYSSIELAEDAIAHGYRRAKRSGPWQVVSVGSMSQMYKGYDIWLDAISLVRSRGLDVWATIVGDGKFRGQLEAQARSLGISDYVRFTGQLTAGDSVRRVLDSADAFILPSRTEGLPRALLEAMARALPCLGTRVGGIPELLEDSELVEPGNPQDLANKMQSLLQAPERMESLSNRNRNIALEYREEVLRERRRQFYDYVRATTEEFQRSKRR